MGCRCQLSVLSVFEPGVTRDQDCHHQSRTNTFFYPFFCPLLSIYIKAWERLAKASSRWKPHTNLKEKCIRQETQDSSQALTTTKSSISYSFSFPLPFHVIICSLTVTAWKILASALTWHPSPITLLRIILIGICLKECQTVWLFNSTSPH